MVKKLNIREKYECNIKLIQQDPPLPTSWRENIKKSDIKSWAKILGKNIAQENRLSEAYRGYLQLNLTLEKLCLEVRLNEFKYAECGMSLCWVTRHRPAPDRAGCSTCAGTATGEDTVATLGSHCSAELRNEKLLKQINFTFETYFWTT